MHGHNDNTQNNTTNSTSAMVFHADRINRDFEKTVYFFQVHYDGKTVDVPNLHGVFECIKSIREKEDVFINGTHMGIVTRVYLFPYCIVCTNNCIGNDIHYNLSGME